MQSTERPYVLFVAEIIYLKIIEIKKKNLNFSNIDAIEAFIGSALYEKISSGNFHDEWFAELQNNNFIDQKTNKKIPDETLNLLKVQKDILKFLIMMEQIGRLLEQQVLHLMRQTIFSWDLKLIFHQMEIDLF